MKRRRPSDDRVELGRYLGIDLARPRRGLVAIGAGLYVLSTYASIVSMRIIGLYYHHFKNDFAWSWE